ncbi:hypothetical protein EV361DRAFT_952771 [Lentinula raphanica]|nr:hypothetical protein EV361DRAFT_952771 [Lentinula raphanica]
MKNNFVLLEAEENEDDSEWDHSDNDEGSDQPTAKVPSEYNLPSANAPSRLDRLLQHLEEVVHLQHVGTRSNHVPPAQPSAPAHNEDMASVTSRRVFAPQPQSSLVQLSAPPSPSDTNVSTTSSSKVLPMPKSTSSNRTKGWKGLDLTFDGELASAGELELESEAELSDEQRELELWITKYLGPGGLAVPGFELFYVRCERQHEYRIVERIRTDIQHGNVDPMILRAAFPSALPGGIYLQARSMLPQNTILATYLLTIPGFLYSKTPQVVFPAHETAGVPAAPARTDLVLPIHSTVEDPTSIERILREPSYLNQYSPSTWIKCKQGLYKADVGLVVVDDFDEIDHAVERLVLFPPRIDWSRVPDFSTGQTALKRKRKSNRPEILSREAGNFLAQNYVISGRIDCPQHCEFPGVCSHSEAARKRYIWLDHQWQNGLVLVRLKLEDMELASEILADSRYYFLASNHPAVQQSLFSMPAPSSWEFQIGEAIRFIDFNGTWCTPDGHYTFELPEGRTEGIIHHVGSSFCEIKLPLQGLDYTVDAFHAMPKVHLEKVFQPGDTVLLLSGARQRLSSRFGYAEVDTGNLPGREGLVVTVAPAKVEVLLHMSHNEQQIFSFHPNTLTIVERSVSDYHSVPRYRPEDYWPAPDCFAHEDTYSFIKNLTRTGQIPWKNLQVYPIKYSKKGYRATVVDAKLDENNVSGVSVQIRFETQGISDRFTWIDYDSLRRADNDRFLHDRDGLHEAGQYPICDSFWNLRPGYCPTYSTEEQRSWKKRRLLEKATETDTSDTAMIRATTPLSFPPSTASDPDLDPAWDPCSPDPVQHWILDRRIVQGLQEGLELLVATKSSPKRDRHVFLQIVDGETRVYSILGSRKRARTGQIVRVDPWTILDHPRSFSVPSNPAKAKGLFIISSGNHTGVLCRRLTYMMRLEPSHPPHWLVQAVKLIRKPTKHTQFFELLDNEIGCHWVEPKDLVAVHETTAMRNSGNDLMDPIRSLYRPEHEK